MRTEPQLFVGGPLAGQRKLVMYGMKAKCYLDEMTPVPNSVPLGNETSAKLESVMYRSAIFFTSGTQFEIWVPDAMTDGEVMALLLKTYEAANK